MSKTHRLQVLIPPELHVRITREAQRSRVSRGEWVRRAIQTALVERQSAVDPVKALASLKAPTADIHQMLTQIDTGRQ